MYFLLRQGKEKEGFTTVRSEQTVEKTSGPQVSRLPLSKLLTKASIYSTSPAPASSPSIYSTSPASTYPTSSASSPATLVSSPLTYSCFSSALTYSTSLASGRRFPSPRAIRTREYIQTYKASMPP
jgi:hypothetical protein